MNTACLAAVFLLVIALICFAHDWDIYGLFVMGCSVLWNAVGYIENVIKRSQGGG